MTNTTMLHWVEKSATAEATEATGPIVSRELVQDLVERHQNWLIHLAASYLRDVQSAEDCVQDVFLAAITKMDPSLPDTSLRNWLAACTANRAKSILRSARVRRLVLTDSQDLMDRSYAGVDDYAAFDDSGLLTHVMNLPLKYREVIVLRYYHDLMIADIAVILSASENTVKTRLKRGKEKLRVVLQDEGGEW